MPQRELSRGAGAIITLTTDFGLGSPYVGQMKGVLLHRAPEAALVDLTHAIPAFDVRAAALTLGDAVSAFADGTVHLVVVDPGVGTARRPLVIAWRGHAMVGPDNGVFESFLDEGAVHVIARRDIFRQPVSDVFHGRDLFAPAAAFLARGGLPAELGPPVDDPVRLRWPQVVRQPHGARAPVLRADGFGNLMTRLSRADVPAEVRAVGLTGQPGGERLEIPLRRTYGEVAPGALVALFGSSGWLEVAVSQGSAAERLGAGAAELWVEVSWG